MVHVAGGSIVIIGGATPKYPSPIKQRRPPRLAINGQILNKFNSEVLPPPTTAQPIDVPHSMLAWQRWWNEEGGGRRGILMAVGWWMINVATILPWQ